MNKKVLVVDDDKDVAGFIEKGFLRRGLEVEVAFDGLEAKEKIMADKPDVIIIDLMMPRLNGWEVLKWMRDEAKLAIPTIIVSAKDELDDMKKGMLRADTYLVKPVTLDDILLAIRAVCSLGRDARDL